MKILVTAAAAAAAIVPLATTSCATSRDSRYAQSREYQRELSECNRELRSADSRREYRSELNECRREVAEARRDAQRDWRRYGSYDWNRYEPGYNDYYADRYYRNGSYYTDRRLTGNDRIYRGQDGRYYCRRSDGTTGLIVGAAIGGFIGNRIDNGGSSLLGTLIGAGVGGALGREVERGNVRCD